MWKHQMAQLSTTEFRISHLYAGIVIISQGVIDKK